MINLIAGSVLLVLIYNICRLISLRGFPRHQNTKIAYISNNFIIIDKQADLKINSNNRNEKTVQTFLKAKFPELANEKLYHEYYFPHRLDYATSGILCIPKTKKACTYVSEAFSARTTRKYYIALVYGLLSKEIIDINIPIGLDLRKEDIQKMCTNELSFCKDSRVSRTIITSLEEGLFNNYPATKILCRPITGRRHQIRVHCSYLGHRIIGDYTYSNGKDTEPSRMFLHSARLVLPNPIENLDISTKDPFNNIKYWSTTKTVKTLQCAFNKIDVFYVNASDVSF